MPKRFDGKAKRKAENFHFWIRQELADKFRNEAKSRDRELTWMIHKILEERYAND